MVAFRFSSFGGELPAVDAHLLPENAAAQTKNTWLYSGTINGLPTPKLVKTLQSTTAKVYRIPQLDGDALTSPNQVWLEFNDANTDVVRAPMLQDKYNRVYWASQNGVPQYTTLDRARAGAAALYLGVPNPLSAPVVKPGLSNNDTTPPAAKAASVAGKLVSVQFAAGRQLNGAKIPALSQFSVVAGTTSLNIVTATVDAVYKKLLLTVSTTPDTTQTITVKYTPAGADTDIQDSAGLKASAFALTATALGPVSLQASGFAVTLTFTGTPLDGTKIPATTRFTVQAGSTTYVVTNVTIDQSANTLTLTTSQPVLTQTAVTVTYDPSSSLTLQNTNATPVGKFIIQGTSDAPKYTFTIPTGLITLTGNSARLTTTNAVSPPDRWDGN
jgi:uncharacterized repeat protein (TIGR02059 family)